MTPKQKDIGILALLIIVLVAVNYGWINNALSNFLNIYEPVHVDRIIDGDTIESNKTSIRLLGINAPERGEYFYEEAKEFLEELILNQTVYLKYGKEKYDKYGRTLAYIYINRENINLKLIENGYANYYFPSGKDQYYKEFKNAWDVCIKNQINLCEPSTHICSQCIEIKNSDTIINNCNFSCDINEWKIKTEGRNKFVFNKTLQPDEEAGFELELADFGKSLFLRDDEERLVEWQSC